MAKPARKKREQHLRCGECERIVIAVGPVSAGERRRDDDKPCRTCGDFLYPILNGAWW